MFISNEIMNHLQIKDRKLINFIRILVISSWYLNFTLLVYDLSFI